MKADDVLLVGGGLASGLIASALLARRPGVSVLVLEKGETFGGNHTWCFHTTDLDEPGRALVDPFVAHRWPVHEVRFPGTGTRRLNGGYCAVTSERFHAVLAQRLGDRVRFNANVVRVAPTHVVLDTGERLDAGAVIDCRGPAPSPHLSLGFQKFLGVEVSLAHAVDLQGPILMDATVPQDDGYRFIYVLPLAADRLLIEATAYANSPHLPGETYRRDALAYAKASGWEVASVVREEEGVLPITLGGNIDRFWREADGQPLAGLRAGLFHPATGYSLPEAVRLANLIADEPKLNARPLFDAISAHAKRRWRTQSFYRAVNRMLFLAGTPSDRVKVFKHFYRLPMPLIARFYRGDSSLLDKARILSGRPPVPVPGALRALVRRHPHITETA
jgi:lycopene beta-cyclase